MKSWEGKKVNYHPPKTTQSYSEIMDILMDFFEKNGHPHKEVGILSVQLFRKLFR